MTILSVFIGGGFGALARFLLSGFISNHAFTAIPLGTLAENVCGSLLIGFLFETFEGSLVPGPLRALTMVGFIGGFTTFSTYALETVLLIEKRRYAAAALNFAGQNALGFLAVVAGIVLSDLIRYGYIGGRHA
jgi:CrcB protein